MGWFLFDTGVGGSLIAPETADRLGLAPFGQDKLSGFGPEVHDTRMRRAQTFELGPLKIEQLVFLERRGSHMASRTLGEQVAGALGWDVLLRAIVEIDPRAPSILLHEPAQELELPGGKWEPLTLHFRVPYVAASFDGGEGHFCLDTGAGDLTVLFHADAVRRLDLLAGRETEGFQGGGAGEAVAMERGKLAWFEVGGHWTSPAPAVFSVGEDGEADPYALGFLGAGLLEPYRMVYDYAGGRVAFVPC